MPALTSDPVARAMAALESAVTRVLRGRADPDAPWAGARLTLVWLLTRLVVVLLVATSPTVVTDINYFGVVLTGQAPPDSPGTLREYPVPALWMLSIPAVIAAGDVTAYGWWFVLAMLVVDGLLLLALQRVGGEPRAVTAWLAAGVAVGPLLLLRFDLVTGTAVAVGLLVVAARPRLAGVLLTVAASVKVWPAVLVGLVGAAARGRRAYLAAAAGAAALLVLVSVATSGGERLLTPLTYQSGRGLQVESLAAFPFMLLWALRVGGYTVELPPSLAFEVTGPGAAAVATLSTVLLVAALGWTAWLTVACWRRRPAAPASVPWAVLSSLSLLLLCNKVFSPQYLVWLLPTAVAVVALTKEQAARTCAWLGVVAALAAQLLYPGLYDYVIDQRTVAGNLAGVALVGVKLAAVAGVAWIATRRTWQLLRQQRAAVDAAG